MAFIKNQFICKSINTTMNMNCIVPITEKNDLKTLYLLHGYGNNYTCWQSYTSIQRYAERYELTIIMADFGKSFYTNFSNVDNYFQYWDFASSEMIEISRNIFPNLSHKREDTFVAGISMGGFGAFKLALNCPEKFSYAGSLSGALDLQDLMSKFPDRKAEYSLLLDENMTIKKTQNDLEFVAEKINDLNLPKPKLYQYCGKNDFLYKQNLKFNHFMTQKGFDITYSEDDGTHSWDYWDKELERFLAWLPLEKQVKVSKY